MINSSPPERQSVIIEPLPSDSLSSLNSSQRDSGVTMEPDEAGGDYETVDFEIKKETNPAPNYPAPPRPLVEGGGGNHSYAVIDLADEEDSDGYEEVRLGTKQKKASIKKTTKADFASPNILRGLPSPSRSRSHSRSPPTKRTSMIDGKRPPSPPHSPTESNLMPMDFSRRNKSPSPGNASASDSEPVMEDLESIRAKLRKSAEDSVKAELHTNKSSPPSTAPYKRTDSTPSNNNNGSINKLKSETTPSQFSPGQRNQSFASQLPGNQPPSQMPRKQSAPQVSSSVPGSRNELFKSKGGPPLPSVQDYDHLSAVLDSEIDDAYSLAEPWQQELPQPNPPSSSSSSEVFSTYDILTSPPSNGEESKRVRLLS